MIMRIETINTSYFETVSPSQTKSFTLSIGENEMLNIKKISGSACFDSQSRVVVWCEGSIIFSTYGERYIECDSMYGDEILIELHNTSTESRVLGCTIVGFLQIEE